MPPLAPNILGICGAPCTGKTTLAKWLAKELNGSGVSCALLDEPARELAAQGVRIDAAMGRADYEAFLAAYMRRDRRPDALCVADRTPLDYYTYLAVNQTRGTQQPLPPEFLRLHKGAALAALARYRLLLYLPNALGLRDDKFRVTDPAYQRALDDALRELLAEAPVRAIELPVRVKLRRQAALDAIAAAWPELHQQQAAKGAE